MALQDVLLNYALDGMTTVIAEVSLHQADPGASGTDEVTGGTYARQVPSFNAATAGSVSIDSPLSFNVPGGGTVVAWVGLWDAADVWLGGIQLSQSETFAADGTFQVTSLTINADNA